MASRAMVDLLHRVLRDEEFLRQMRTDPESALDVYKLTRAERDALLHPGEALEEYLRSPETPRPRGTIFGMSLQTHNAPMSEVMRQLPPRYRQHVPTMAEQELAKAALEASGEARKRAIAKLLKAMDGRDAAAPREGRATTGEAQGAPGEAQAQVQAQATTGADHIYIVGLGMVGARQVTGEVEGALRAAKAIFYVDQGVGVKEYLAGLCPNITNLVSSYHPGENRIEAYDRMAAAVLNAALKDPPVAFAVYGHPLVYVYPTQQILRASAPLLLNLRYLVLPGVSSLDSMFIDLQVDPGTQGLQMYEATDLLLRQRPLQTDVPCIIWQAGSVESVLYSTAESLSDRFKGLEMYLKEIYGPDHVVFAVYTPTHPLVQPDVKQISLKTFAVDFAALPGGDTIYIPPKQTRAIANQALLEELTSEKHLRDITKPAPPAPQPARARTRQS